MINYRLQFGYKLCCKAIFIHVDLFKGSSPIINNFVFDMIVHDQTNIFARSIMNA